jgi:aminoglycoside 3-N-acetyltransferase
MNQPMQITKHARKSIQVEVLSLVSQLQDLGLQQGDIVMVHASFKSLRVQNPESIILALLEVMGESGTLLMPALSYLQNPPDVHDTNMTPSCVGFLSEYFRCRTGTLRSLHPTHSVCGVGKEAHAWLSDHILDHTPCGFHSPFNKLFHQHGKILMIGCGLEPNTSMHAVEEYIEPSYLYNPPQVYTITDSQRRSFTKKYTPHNFYAGRAIQRYDRVGAILNGGALRAGKLGEAKTYLIQAETLFQAALDRLRVDPLYFVDIDPEG